MQDLMAQSYRLISQDDALGARILLRSGFETLAILAYLNKIMSDVVDGRLNFFKFSEKIAILLSGSKDGSTRYKAASIMDALRECDKVYPGVLAIYEKLSEAAHPNYDGLCRAYLRSLSQHKVVLMNRCSEIYEPEQHIEGMRLCMSAFEREYNEVWPDVFEQLEGWILRNIKMLEDQKPAE